VSETVLPTAVTVAIIGGVVSLLALALNNMISGWRDCATRQRQEFSKALAACVAYEEFPYVVRRRKSNAQQNERIRISSELSLIQRDIAYYSAWLATESIPVSKAYETLVAKLREIAGGKIRRLGSHHQLTPSAMNMPDLGLGTLKPLKDIYLSEVDCHLSLVPRPIRRIWKKRRPM
jgi:hypothetical protein